MGVHLTKGQPTHSITLGNEMSLLGGTSGPCNQSHHTHWKQDVSVWGKVRLTFCSIGSQPASQLARCNWPAIQPCDKISTCQILGWSDGGRRTGSLTTLGLSTGSQHSHWFPLGSDLPDQGQTSDTNELCSPLCTVGTTFRDYLQFCIYVT